MWATADESREQIVALHEAAAGRPTRPSRHWTWTHRVGCRGGARRRPTSPWASILVHMIAETAHHAGHADIVREMILIGSAGHRIRTCRSGRPSAWAAYRSNLEQIAESRRRPDWLSYAAVSQPRPRSDRSSRASARGCSSGTSVPGTGDVTAVADGVSAAAARPAASRCPAAAVVARPRTGTGSRSADSPAVTSARSTMKDRRARDRLAPGGCGDAVEDRRTDGGIGGRGVGQQGFEDRRPHRADRTDSPQQRSRAGGSGGAAPAAPALVGALTGRDCEGPRARRASSYPTWPPNALPTQSTGPLDRRAGGLLRPGEHVRARVGGFGDRAPSVQRRRWRRDRVRRPRSVDVRAAASAADRRCRPSTIIDGHSTVAGPLPRART